MPLSNEEYLQTFQSWLDTTFIQHRERAINAFHEPENLDAVRDSWLDLTDALKVYIPIQYWEVYVNRFKNAHSAGYAGLCAELVALVSMPQPTISELDSLLESLGVEQGPAYRWAMNCARALNAWNWCIVVRDGGTVFVDDSVPTSNDISELERLRQAAEKVLGGVPDKLGGLNDNVQEYLKYAVLILGLYLAIKLFK